LGLKVDLAVRRGGASMHYSEDLEGYSLIHCWIFYGWHLKITCDDSPRFYNISNGQPHLQNGCGIVSFAFFWIILMEIPCKSFSVIEVSCFLIL
jgi:hypothetical protein